MLSLLSPVVCDFTLLSVRLLRPDACLSTVSFGLSVVPSVSQDAGDIITVASVMVSTEMPPTPSGVFIPSEVGRGSVTW